MAKSQFYLKNGAGTPSKKTLMDEAAKLRDQKSIETFTIYLLFTYSSIKPFRYCTQERVKLCDWQEWDGRGNTLQRIYSRVNNSAEINLRLEALQAKIEAVERSFRERGIIATHDELRASISPQRAEMETEDITRKTFYQYFDWYVKNKLSQSDKKNYHKCLLHLRQYAPQLQWQDLTLTWYKAYMHWLANGYINPRTKKKGILNSTAAKDTRYLVKLCKMARKNGIKLPDDFEEFERPYFDPLDTRRHFITDDRLHEVFTFDFTRRELYTDRTHYRKLIDNILRARDIYAFSFDTGLAYAELSGTKATQLTQEYNERAEAITCLVFGRDKTQRVNMVPLSKRCLEIIKKYEGAQPTLLPYFENQHYNDLLKRMFKLAGFTRRITLARPMGNGQRIDTYEEWELLTSHTGRHSAATNILEKTGDNLILARDLLGHSSIKTTEIYVHNRKERHFSKILAVVDGPKEEKKAG